MPANDLRRSRGRPSVTHHRGADEFVSILHGTEFDFNYMLCHEAATDFPSTDSALDAYVRIILGDIGANTLLLSPDVWTHSRRAPNRLKLLRSYVERGGGLIMVGGYYSFQGINGAARYRNTAVDAVLPTAIYPYEHRIELPEGVVPELGAGAASHPVLNGVLTDFPYLLGINEVVAKPEATTLLALPVSEGGHPLLAVQQVGVGRRAAWTTDIGPHWLPNEFLRWDGFKPLWSNLLHWVSRK